MKMMPSFRSRPLLISAATAALLTACNGGGGPGGPPGGTEMRSSQVRVTAPVVQAGDLATLAADNRHFAWDLYQAVATGTDNLVFSPASISIALGMTYGGAAGATATQMASTLHFSLPPARLHPTFDALDLALEAPPPAGADAGAFQLSLANAIWGQKGFTFVPAYLDLLAEDYGAGLHVVDFAGATEAARQTINQWVSDATQAQIPMLLAQGVLDAGTVFVLTNAVYFHADWQTSFMPNSPMGTFQAPAGPVQVPMMSAGSETTFAGASATGYKLAVVPYKGPGTSMVLIVPDAGTFAAFTAGLTFDALETILAGATPTRYVLSMPRFKFQTSLALADVLGKLGMPDAFTGAADFSGIDGAHDIFISAVVHQATIAVDEKGTTAAAATAVGVGTAAVALAEPLVVDRPFLFAIRDDATGSILFLGHVLDPSKM
jgi:serpin B